MILPEFAELAPSRGTGSVCTDTTARMAIALKNQWQPSVPVVHALHFQHSAGLLLLSHRWFLFISFSIPNRTYEGGCDTI